MDAGAAPGLEERILDALGDAVMVLDDGWRVRGWAGAAERLVGGQPSDTTGIFAMDLAPDGFALPSELVGLDRHERADVAVELAPGSRLAVTLTPLREAGGGRVGTVAVIKPAGAWLDPSPRPGGDRRRWQRTLGRIVHDLTELRRDDRGAFDDTADVARILVGRARRLLPRTEVVLAVLPGPDGEQPRVTAGAGPWAESMVGAGWPRPGTAAGRALSGGVPVEGRFLDDLGPGGISSGSPTGGRLVPLMARRPMPDGRVAFGVIGFFRTAPASFTPYQRRLIDGFARLAAVILQRTELRRIAADAAARLRTGVEVAVELGHHLEPVEVMARLLAHAVRAAQADRACVLAVDGEAATLEGVVGGDVGAGPSGVRVPLAELVADGETLALAAARERLPRAGGPYDASRLPAGWRAALGGTRHTLTLPLVLSGETRALLVVGRVRDAPFGQNDMLTLRLVGNVAVLALRNARLFVDVREAGGARGHLLDRASRRLRAPLAVIGARAAELASGHLGELPPDWAEPLGLVAAKSGELIGLVDDLQLVAGLERGTPTRRSGLIDLGGAVLEAASRAAPRAGLLGAEIVVEPVSSALPVRADLEDVARVLDNLVNNALTYRRPSEPGWVRLSAAQEGSFAVAAVEDRGIGVPEAIRERIFERFAWGRMVGEGPSGSGLGLHISRRLAARHGGSVELDRTRPGAGSTFSLRLPLSGT
jgi:signal transduction histidine kinase